MARVNGPSRRELDARGNELAARTRRAIDSTLRTVTARVEVEELNRIRSVWRDVALRSLVPRVHIAWDTAVSGVRKQLEQPAGPDSAALAAAAFEIPKVSNALAEVFLAEATNRLVGIGDHVWEVARAELLEGMQLGEGVAELRARVMASADVSARRADVIARTEVNSAMNNGAYQQMKTLDMPTIKEWIATDDARTRESHEEVDGEEIAGDAKFMVGGSPMDHPHDLTAPPGETINCRCTMAWEVDFDALDAEEDDEDDELDDELDNELDDDELVDSLFAAGVYDEAKHKRDGKGRFAKKAGVSAPKGKKLKVTHGLVHKKHAPGTVIAVSGSDKKRVVWDGNKYLLQEKQEDGGWVTTSTAIKSKAYVEIGKFDDDWRESSSDDDNDADVPAVDVSAPTPAITTPADGAKSIKITHGLVHKKHEPGEVITENGAGNKRVVWDGDKYRLQEKNTAGNWVTGKTAIKSKAYKEINEFDSDWRVPSDASAVSTAPSAPVSAPKPGDRLKITSAVASGNHDVGDIVTESGDGANRVIWDGDEYRIQVKDENGWKTSRKVGPDKAADVINTYNDDWRVPKYKDIVEAKAGEAQSSSTGPTKTKTTAPTSQPSTTAGSSGTKTYTMLQKAKVQAIFDKNNLKWHNKSDAIYDAAHEVSTTHSDLTMADALDIMDQSLKKKTGNPFRTKVEKWLKTNAGKQHALAKGSSASVGGTSPTTPASPAPVNPVTPKIPAGGKVAPNVDAPGVTYLNNSAYVKPGTTVPPGTSLSAGQLLNSPTGAAYKPVDDPGGALSRNLNRQKARILQQRMSLATPPPWTSEQHASLVKYTGSAYREMNGCARGTGDCSPEVLKDIANIKAAMKPSTDTVTLHRMTDRRALGISNSDDVETKMAELVGKTIKDDGVISTATEGDVWSGQITLEIEAPKGSMMAYVQPISKHPTEEEMILAPGTHYEVVSVTPDRNGGYAVKLRVIPGSDARSREDREKLALQQQIENLQKAKANA